MISARIYLGKQAQIKEKAPIFKKQEESFSKAERYLKKPTLSSCRFNQRSFSSCYLKGMAIERSDMRRVDVISAEIWKAHSLKELI